MPKKIPSYLKKISTNSTLKTMLNKPQFFYLTKTTEDQIFDKIIEGIAANNDEYYIKHSDGSSVFTVKKEPKWRVKKEQ